MKRIIRAALAVLAISGAILGYQAAPAAASDEYWGCVGSEALNLGLCVRNPLPPTLPGVPYATTVVNYCTALQTEVCTDLLLYPPADTAFVNLDYYANVGLDTGFTSGTKILCLVGTANPNYQPGVGGPISVRVPTVGDVVAPIPTVIPPSGGYLLNVHGCMAPIIEDGHGGWSVTNLAGGFVYGITLPIVDSLV